MVERVDLQSSTLDFKPQFGQIGLHFFSTGGRGRGREIVDKVNLEAFRCDLCNLLNLDIWSHFSLSIFLPFYQGGEGVAKKVNLKSSRYALKPKINHLGRTEPFFLCLYILDWAVGTVEEVNVYAFQCDLIPQQC